MPIKKVQHSAQAIQLEQIPNIGPSLADDLRQIGINKPDQLKDKDGIVLYHLLNKRSGAKHDPCVADTFLAAVDFMNGAPARPWWTYTKQRKELLK